MKISRKIDDAVGATGVHLIGGIWGQLAVGLFADAPTGPKGLLLGGGPFQLIVQAISAISLSVWAAVVTVIILFIVNQIIPIRLEPEHELLGCDLSEHYLNESSNEMQKSLSTIDRIIHVTTPIAKRFAGSTESRSNREMDDFGRRKAFHTNHGYEEH